MEFFVSHKTVCLLAVVWSSPSVRKLRLDIWVTDLVLWTHCQCVTEYERWQACHPLGYQSVLPTSHGECPLLLESILQAWGILSSNISVKESIMSNWRLFFKYNETTTTVECIRPSSYAIQPADYWNTGLAPTITLLSCFLCGLIPVW